MPSSLDDKPPTKPEATLQPSLSRSQSNPQPSFDVEKGEHGVPTEFDPCATAHFTSPFYDHDSPRVSSECFSKTKPATMVQVYAFEAQPSTQSLRKSSSKKCMTKPRPRNGWWNKLSNKQKLGMKILLAMVVIGAVVGLAVGLTKRVGGGVYKNQNQLGNV